MKGVIASLSISPRHSTCDGTIWFLTAFTNTIDQKLVVVTYARQHVVILHKDASIQSSQLLRGRTVHLELSSSTDMQLPSYIHVLSWS